ncbi:hypothetical protein GCM10017083_20640 [Thalassobaculum fulvum]|uniref:DUF2189 domain-containing protein n=1 Tax=Thalassobaculum fulvum TaxID=1633335 RepID=A0A918XS75_9PROT|nr:DUF2189 domain-containing protein [Thalassobaculum fulvum]GHD48947.1 hypothetical protein GCM10017083_20640 [Thalassobaculum fulvum]
MAIGTQIRNPLEWGWDQLKKAESAVEATGHALGGAEAGSEAGPAAVRRIRIDDLRDALARGVDDFRACRTDVLFLCLVYPVAGLLLAYLAFGYDFLHLVFPLASGFALLGPIAAIGLYEMSRRRERGQAPSWADALSVVGSPAFGAILVLGLYLLAAFLLWLVAAVAIYGATLGPEPPTSIGAFAQEIVTTGAGWAMIAIGIAVGFVFAVVVMTVSVVSFPMLLDRDVGLYPAIGTSIRAVAANPLPMAVWGAIVAGGLLLGAVTLFIGLAVVMPVLGHATWHLYRKLVAD